MAAWGSRTRARLAQIVWAAVLMGAAGCRRRTGGQTADERAPTPTPTPLVLQLPSTVVDRLPPLQAIPGDLQSAARVARGGVCGYAEVAGRYYPLDCLRTMATPLRWASRAVLLRTLVSSEEGDPSTVDPRHGGALGPVRDQGQVGSCTAFSLAATIDRELRRDGITGAPVSAMLLWSRYHTPSMPRAASANTGRLLAPQSAWPYDEATACGWRIGDACECPGGCGHAVDPAQQRLAEAQATAELVDVERIDDDTASLRHTIARGRSVWFGMVIGRALQGVRGTNAVVPDFDARGARTGHAMALVGYTVLANGTWFLIQNSWGRDWGDQGFAWIHERTLHTNLSTGHCYAVQVRRASAPTPEPDVDPDASVPEVPALPEPPTQPDASVEPPADRPPAGDPAAVIPALLDELLPPAHAVDRIVSGIVAGFPGTPGTCPATQVPDALTGACVAQCPDGSPPVLGQCAQSGRCAPSNIDVGGRCFHAAPRRARTRDVPTGVTYQCGVGGCVYWIASGAYACRHRSGCVVSCAAPRSVLVASERGLNCSF